MIKSSTSFYYFIKTNSSWIIIESIKALEIKTCFLSNLDFADNTTLSCFFFFFLIIDWYFWIPAVYEQMFNPITELIIPIGTPNKEAKGETEIHPLIVESKIRKCWI